MALAADVRERIAQLVPTLSSNQIGEVNATAAAIGRVLVKAGASWHDLAGVIKGTITERAQAQMREPPPQYSDQMRPGRPKAEYASRSQAEHRHRKTAIKGSVWGRELREAIDDIEKSQGGDLDGLGERAFTFLESLRDRTQKFETVRISAKQDRWIRSIARDNGVTIPWEEIEGEA